MYRESCFMKNKVWINYFHDHYTYDANGNPTLVTNDSTNTTREMYWDEDNRLIVLSDNGKTSRYTYNAAGARVMKSYGTMEGVYINGAPQGITFHETDNFTLYPASILSVNKNRFTKHYFIGDKRIASRIGIGPFNNVYGRNGSYVTTGQQDYAERMTQIQKQKEAYYKQQGIAPGVPTEKGAYGDPENTGVGYNAVLTELGNHDVPQDWIQTPRPNTTPGTNPGPPVSWNDPSNPGDPQAGYGYIANDTTKEETFFYHCDFITTNWRGKFYWTPIISKHVYGGSDAADTQRDLEKSGWKVSHMFDDLDLYSESGLKSQFYERTKNGKKEFCYAFAGTDFTSIGDDVTDVQQFLEGFLDNIHKPFQMQKLYQI